MPWLWSLPPNDEYYYPLYVTCIELGIPFCTQVGHTGPVMPSETGRPVPYLDEVALTFPELTLVGEHIVYIDTSTYLPKYYPPELVHFMKTSGQDKVLFGTNFPQLTFERCREQIPGLGPPPEVEKKFLLTIPSSIITMWLCNRMVIHETRRRVLTSPSRHSRTRLAGPSWPAFHRARRP